MAEEIIYMQYIKILILIYNDSDFIQTHKAELQATGFKILHEVARIPPKKYIKAEAKDFKISGIN